jgi:hypothetical protein
MSHRDGLRGFASLRTHPNVPLQAPVPAERHCVSCGAVLARGNQTNTCAPCTGEYELPMWAIGLAESGVHMEHIAALVLEAMAPAPAKRSVRERNELIRKFYAQGYSQYDLAKSFAMPRTSIAEIVNDRYGREGGAIEKGKSRPEAALSTTISENSR